MIKIRNHKTYRIADRLRAIGKQVSDSLIRIVRGLNGQPRYLVAKGGTAPSDVATRGLGGAAGHYHGADSTRGACVETGE